MGLMGQTGGDSSLGADVACGTEQIGKRCGTSAVEQALAQDVSTETAWGGGRRGGCSVVKV